MANIQGKPNGKPQGSAANRQSANRKKNKVIKAKHQEKELSEEKLNAINLAKVEAEADKRNREKIKAAEDAAKKARAEAKKKAEEDNKKVPTSTPLVLTLEDKINNEFDEMGVSFAYGNLAQKRNAVRRFADYVNANVKPEELDAVKAQVSKRLEADDFFYNYEPINLAGLKEFEPQMYEKREVQKEFEPHTSSQNNNQTKETPAVSKHPSQNNGQEASHYQTLVDGINNEEMLNPHKGYSNEDLKKIIGHHNNLLENSDGNGTNFESLYENSYSDLKKFADGILTIDKDSYETMKEFIKIFGTNSKGILTPEGKAAYDKLMSLIEEAEKEAKKDRILQHKKEVKEDKNTPERDAAILGILGSLAQNAEAREKNKPQDEFFIGDDSTENNNNGNNHNNNGNNNDKNVIIPIVPENSDVQNNTPTIVPVDTSKTDTAKTLPADATNKKTEKKKKKSWKKWLIVAAIIAAAALLKDCFGHKSKDDDNANKPDTTKVVPAPVDTLIVLDKSDMSNGFQLERSEGFTAEQNKSSFKDAEKINMTDMLNVKKLLVKGSLDVNKFVRNPGAKAEGDVKVDEITYKMKIITTNFPKSQIAKDINEMFKGNVTPQSAANIYTAFSRIDEEGHVLDANGKRTKTIPGKKNIDQDRRGPGSEKYGTEGTFDNFVQVYNNLKGNKK